MEGSECFDPPQGCDPSALTLSVLDYDHDDGCSVTGSFVYRGVALRELTGLYLYSAFQRCGRRAAGVARARTVRAERDRVW
jgi:hypothetical protein